MRRILLLLPLLSMPATADAATFRGETSQGRPAMLRTGEDGLVRKVSVRWRADCDEGGTLRDRTVLRAPFDRSSTMRLRQEVDYADRDADDPVRIRIKGAAGAKLVSPRRWRGTFRATGVVRQRGRVIARCALPKISFTLKR